MFPTKHYVAVIKAKDGEYRALEETLPATKDSMTPLFEITPIPWDYDTDTEGKTIDAHLNRVGQRILDTWGVGRPFFVDSNFIDGSRVMSDGTHHLVYLFDDFRAKGLSAIPVIGLDRVQDYKQAVQTIAQQDDRGICLRLQSADLLQPDLRNRIDADLAFYGVRPNQTHLVIDMGSISEGNEDLLVFSMTTFINNALPYLLDWYSFTIAATAFPSDLSDIRANTIDTIDRVEWHVWNRLLGGGLQRTPSFGDYSIAHPDIVALDPRIMRASASIRYTCDDYWLIVRGRWLRFGFPQYRNLCQNLILRHEYSGAAFSWGDNYINECAAGTVGTGNLTTWRKVGNNHHFQKVVHQISILP